MEITESMRREIARLTEPTRSQPTAYDGDPRVQADGAGGYTVKAADAAYQVREEGSFGWCIYQADGQPVRTATGDPVTGIRYPGKAIGAIIGDPVAA